MNKIIISLVIVLSLVKATLQSCCFTTTITGDGKHSYYVDVMVHPASPSVSISYMNNYNIVGLNPECQQIEGSNKVKCEGSTLKDYFQTRLIMEDPTGAYISSIEMDVRSKDESCQRSYDDCNANGTVKSANGDNYCFFFGCFPKLACYLGLAAFVIVIAGISVSVIRRNSGSGENAALDRPNTKKTHLDRAPNPIGGTNNFNGSSNKETLIQIEEIPVDYKEAGSTNWVNKKYNKGQPTTDLGLGLGSGGFGSKNSLLPQTSNVTVVNDPTAGLNRGRSVKRAQSSRSVKKSRSNDPNHLNAPPLPNGSPAMPTSNLNRTKSSRSTRSVRSTKSVRKTKPEGSSSLTPKKSIRNQPSQKRYQIPSDSESDSSSDSDNEVLGLRAKPSMKRINNSSSQHRGSYHSVKANKSPKSPKSPKSSKSVKSPSSTSPRYYY